LDYPHPLVAFAEANGRTPYESVSVGNLYDDVDWTRFRLIDPVVTDRAC